MTLNVLRYSLLCTLFLGFLSTHGSNAIELGNDLRSLSSTSTPDQSHANSEDQNKTLPHQYPEYWPTHGQWPFMRKLSDKGHQFRVQYNFLYGAPKTTADYDQNKVAYKARGHFAAQAQRPFRVQTDTV